jgi:hypothetical protein
MISVFGHVVHAYCSLTISRIGQVSNNQKDGLNHANHGTYWD